MSTVGRARRRPPSRAGITATAVAGLLVALVAPLLAPAGVAEAAEAVDPAHGATVGELPADATVLHVDGSHADGSAGPGDGSVARPFTTITAAVADAQRRRQAGEAVQVVVAPGTYREHVDITGARWGADPPLVIEPAGDPGSVVVSGADVEDRWSRVGSSDRFAAPWGQRWGLAPVPPSWAHVGVPDGVRRREAVFVDGAPLRQVLSEEALVPGTFWVDDAGERIVVDPPAGVDDLDDALVEVARRPQVLTIRHRASDVVVRGLVVEAAAASLRTPMAEVHDATDVLLEGNTFRHSSWTGLRVCCMHGITVRGNTIADNGGSGVDTYRLRDAVLEANTVTGNNVRGAAHGYVDWSVAGAKHFALRDAVLRDNTYRDNGARGLWFDTDVANVLVDGVRSCDNAVTGLFVEKVQGPLVVHDATVCDNLLGGIVVATSGNVDVQRSTIEGNGRGQLVFSGRRLAMWFDNTTWALVTMRDFTGITLVENTVDSSDDAHGIYSPVLSAAEWRGHLRAGRIAACGNTWQRPTPAGTIRMQDQDVPMSDWDAMTGDGRACQAGS